MEFSGFPDPPDISMNSESSDISIVNFSGFDESLVPRPTTVSHLDLVSDSMDFIPHLASSATAHELNQLLPDVPSYMYLLILFQVKNYLPLVLLLMMKSQVLTTLYQNPVILHQKMNLVFLHILSHLVHLKGARMYL